VNIFEIGGRAGYWCAYKMENYLHEISGSGIRDRECIKLVTSLKAIVIIPVYNNSSMDQVSFVHKYS
jgi:hypothetical protein